MKSLHSGKVTAELVPELLLGLVIMPRDRGRPDSEQSATLSHSFQPKEPAIRKQDTPGWLPVEPPEGREKAIETHGQKDVF